LRVANAARPLVGLSRMSLSQPLPVSTLSLGVAQNKVQTVRGFATAEKKSGRGRSSSKGKKRSTKSSSGKSRSKSVSAKGRRKSASGKGKKARSRSASDKSGRVRARSAAKRQREKAELQEKKARKRERSRERREVRLAKEEEKRLAKRERKEVQRENRRAREHEEKEYRAMRREEVRARRRLKKAEAHAKEIDRRAKERERLRHKRGEPGQPPFPKNAFSIFVGDNFKPERKGKEKATEVVKRLALKYKALPEDQRKTYQDRAAEDKKRYEKEFEQWRKTHPAAPKRPVGPYMQFAAEKRPELLQKNPDMKTAAIGKELGSMWRSLSQPAKQKYIDDAAPKFEQFKRQYADWKAKTVAA